MAQNRLTALALAALCAAPLMTMSTSPAAAQDRDRGTLEELGRETDRLLRDLMREMAPALRELEDQLRAFDLYEPPEILPNGDIIIRRKRPLEARPNREARPEPRRDVEPEVGPRQDDRRETRPRRETPRDAPPGHKRQGGTDESLTET
ncbi:MAG: hypothetical protein AAFR46_14695 [Pseudomonadota bacterium]